MPKPSANGSVHRDWRDAHLREPELLSSPARVFHLSGGKVEIMLSELDVDPCDLRPVREVWGQTAQTRAGGNAGKAQFWEVA
jgi:hypothetical protein